MRKALFLISLIILGICVQSAFATVTSTTFQTTYIGNGSVSIYAYPYKIFAPTDLLVTKNASTTLALSTDYAVSGAGNANGGSITLVAGSLTSGATLVISRIEPLTQLTSFRNQGSFIPAKHEDAYDKLTMIAQQLAANAAAGVSQGPAGPAGPAGPTGATGPAGPVSNFFASGTNFASGINAGVSLTSGTNNTLVGNAAGNGITTGIGNTYDGYSSGAHTTSGNYNSGFGAFSLTSNTTGSANTADGWSSLQANTTGQDNCSYGYGSMYRNISGNSNCAFGEFSLYNPTAASYNQAIGEYVLHNLTSGTFNLASGYYAANSLTTGEQNSIYGPHNLDQATTASYNSDFGYYGLYSATLASDNSGFGYQNLYDLTIGNDNNAFGELSLNALTTGSDNSAFGEGSLGAAVTASNCVALGNYAGAYEVASGGFYVDAFDRTNTAGDKAKAILYGHIDTAGQSAQTLTVNATSVTLNGNARFPVGDFVAFKSGSNASMGTTTIGGGGTIAVTTTSIAAMTSPLIFVNYGNGGSGTAPVTYALTGSPVSIITFGGTASKLINWLALDNF